MQNEATSTFIPVEGHRYFLKNFEGVTGQVLQFIQKEPVEEGASELKTIMNGTTNEEVLRALIDRLEFLNKKMYSEYNDEALKGLKSALSALEARTAHRVSNGVEGTATVA